MADDGGYKHLKFPDPHRDCNKLYMGIAGFPTNTKLETDLEDFGVNDKIKEQYNDTYKDKDNDDDKDNGDDKLVCIGDWWIDDKHGLEPKSRLLFFIKSDIQNEKTKWNAIVIKRQDLKDFTIKSVISKLAESFEIKTKGTIIIPVIQPLKYQVKTEKQEGFVYIG